MKLELAFLLVVGILIYDTYYGGVIMKYFNAFKKYYKLAGIIFLIFSIYITIKKDPTQIRDMLMNATNGKITNGYIYPSQGNNKSITNLHQMFSNKPVDITHQTYMPSTDIGGGVKPATKRSVSETKKKFVAYQQGWTCKKCNNMLNAWYEVDHVTRLEHGGSNDVSNLVALCRECHGKKTAIENM